MSLTDKYWVDSETLGNRVLVEFVDLFLFAAKSLGVQPQFCTVVEDSILGVRAGIAAEMKVLWYTSHSESTLLETSGASVFQSMSQLPSLLSHY